MKMRGDLSMKWRMSGCIGWVRRLFYSIADVEEGRMLVVSQDLDRSIGIAQAPPNEVRVRVRNILKVSTR